MWSPGWFLIPRDWCPYKKSRLGTTCTQRDGPVDTRRRRPSTHQGERPREWPALLTQAQVPASGTGGSECLLWKPSEAVECCYSSPSKTNIHPISSKTFFSYPPFSLHEMPSLWSLINLVKMDTRHSKAKIQMHTRALSLTHGCISWLTLIARLSTSFLLLPMEAYWPPM